MMNCYTKKCQGGDASPPERGNKKMPSYYEINVSKNGTHLFATAPRSICNTAQLKKVLRIITEKFPESERV